EQGRLQVRFRGVAGQSFGVFLGPGLDFRLEGEAQDYVGKGLAGGRLVLFPPAGSGFRAREQVIAGNTLLYGATGGELFAAGLVGERFSVRNSGARAVVEGCGDHGCEYMTAGVVVVLGRAGRNFGAGMSGGRAYVLDTDQTMAGRINRSMVSAEPLSTREDKAELKALLERHAQLTGSEQARQLLADWPLSAGLFLRIALKDEVERPEPSHATAIDQEAWEPEQALGL
ncbi:MAG: hypothetical protein MI919_13190, partial [Holophagales bacterium]|nr:hypothetical protein [Holophagales bacterium]